MYLQDYVTPSKNIEATAYEITKKEPIAKVPAREDRIWVSIHNSSNGTSGVPVTVHFTEQGPASFTIAPGQSIFLPSPVYLGDMFLRSSGAVTAVITELLKHG